MGGLKERASASAEAFSVYNNVMGEMLSQFGGKPMEVQDTDEILGAEPKIEWFTYIPDRQYGVTISLAEGCSISATMTFPPNHTDEPSIYVDIFTVDKSHQGKGIGTMLLETLSHEAQKYGVKNLYGHVTSEEALKTRAKVFGENDLTFFSPAKHEHLDLDYKTALKSGSIDFVVGNRIPQTGGPSSS